MQPTDTSHRIASPAQWLPQRLRLLEREKALTRLQDEVARERRALPWVRLARDYVFDAPDGLRPLASLFDGRSQLLVQHFMFGPGWEAGCPSCSFMVDHIDGIAVHLAARDIACVAISSAPLHELERFRTRMGWRFPWVSSQRSSFNRDFGVGFAAQDRVDGKVDYNHVRQPFPGDEAPGISVFAMDAAGAVFHTYSTYGRGVEAMMGAYRLIDLTPRGRHEEGLEHGMAWVRHHDRYAPDPAPACRCGPQR